MMRNGSEKTVARLAVLRKQLFPHGRQQTGHLITLDTCGIIAYIGDKEQAVDFLMEGLRVLEPRGYDSAGIATIDRDAKELVTTKYASVETTSNAIGKLEKTLSLHHNHKVGIAHTRWATHGARTQENAHPHLDHENRIAIVHNGVIENSSELKQELADKFGIKCRSETDSEVIAQLIGQYVKEGDSLLDAVHRTQDRLQGTWGLAILDRENPNMLIAAKNGSPLLIGIGEDKMFIGSEPAAFSKHTKEYIALEDGEVAVLTTKGHSLDRRRIQVAHHENIPKSPAPFPFWTIKEIMEQPAALARALNYGGRLLDESSVKLGGLEANKDVLKNVSHLVIAACGTSYFAAMAGAMYMRYLSAFKTVQVIDAAELGPEIFPKEGGGLLVISQSGETKDVHRALHIAQSMDIPCLSVVNAVGSLIARSTNCGVYLNAGRENAVASTKAFTCQATVLALIAIWFSQVSSHGDRTKRKTLVDSLHRLPTNVGMALRTLQQPCQAVARKLVDANCQHLFVLGKGYALPIALEGALKIKEISYIHAEGYAGGALKHGPYALIEKGTPIIMIILDDRHASKMKTAAEEVKARGAIVIIITNKPEMFSKEDGDIIAIPSNGILTNILSVLPLQLLAYELSIAKGIDPDRPRNLAKSVTVD